MLTKLSRFFRWIAAVLREQQAYRELGQLDDRMLKDIGLARSDLRNAAAEPLYRDPTALLAGRVDEGRTHRPHRMRGKRSTPSRYY